MDAPAPPSSSAARPGSVVITGATGLLGANVAMLLASKGFQVRCTKRVSSKLVPALAARNDIVWVDADLRKKSSLVEAFRGAEFVIHCAAAVYQERYASQEQIDQNVGGTANVVDAVLETGVRRLVYCSSVVTVAIAASVDRPACEEDRWNLPEHGLDDGYAVTMRDAEQLVLQACKTRNLNAVIVNPTYMLGPHDPGSSSSSILIQLIRGEIPGVPGDGMMNFVDVRDVAAGMLAAMQRGQSGQRYILSGHNLTWAAFYELTGRIAGAPVPRTRLPYVLAALVGWWGTARGDNHGLNICRVRWAYCSTYAFTCAKAQRELGYEVHPLEAAIQEAIADFKARQLLL